MSIKSKKSGAQRGFETIWWQKSLGLSLSDRRVIQKTIEVLPELDDEGLRWSKKNYRHGYTSYSSFDQLHQHLGPVEKLEKKIRSHVIQYAKALGFESPGQWVCTQMWANIMNQDCYHAFHLHPGSVISGTFYVKLPKGGSPLRFEDPRAMAFMNRPMRPHQLDVLPQEGDVVLFESWLKHEVPPQGVREPRISISFNYNLI